MPMTEVPLYDYALHERYACPDCYRPVSPPKRNRDGRCARCHKAISVSQPESYPEY